MEHEPVTPENRSRGGASRWLVPILASAAVAGAVSYGVTQMADSGDGRTVTVTERPASAPPAANPSTTSHAPAGGESTSTAALDAEPAPPASADALSAGQIYDRYKLSVVRVESGGSRLGTGFVIDREGHIITNAHVIVAGSKNAVVKLSDGSEHDATVLGRDEDIDVAVLQAKDLPHESIPVPLGSVRTLKVGDPLVAIGNPLGFDLTVTTGIVSALKRPIFSPNQCAVQNVVQTDAAINQGNSGGPLFDDRGRAIGVNSQIATDNGGNVGIGLALPIDIVKPVVASIIDTGTAQHSRLGIMGKAMTPEVQRANGMPGQKGVMLITVQPDGAAAKAGLKGATSGTGENDVPKGGDVVTEVNGSPVEDMPDISLAVSSRRPGDTMTLTVLRGGKTMQVQVTLTNREGPCPSPRP